MKKSALLHQVRLEYEVHLENSRLRETARIHVEKNSRIGIMYHFMHPWEAIFTEYLLHDRNGGIKEGKFDASNRNRLVPEPFSPVCRVLRTERKNRICFPGNCGKTNYRERRMDSLEPRKRPEALLCPCQNDDLEKRKQL